MAHSMTAFARADTETAWGSLAWEIRTVNHRYLEPGFRLPEELRTLEPAVREAVAKRLARGKFDATLKFQPRTAGATDLRPDSSAVLSLLGAARNVAEQATATRATVEPLRVIDVLRWPGVLGAAQLDSAALGQAALALFDRALDDLVANRAREGAALAKIIAERLDQMAVVAREVREVLPVVIAAFRERLVARLAELRAELDPARIEQEIVIFAGRTDVAEELDRLDAHIAETRRTLAQTGGIGRRLDFLMQEFNREANTLGSKSADLRVTNASVELKVLIEQMREQVQNIE
jgi:uncharacterized protein (TIGR00255 family)